MPSTTRGSQLSRTAAKCVRNTTGTPVAGPSSRYAKSTPSTVTVRVGAAEYEVLTSPLTFWSNLVVLAVIGCSSLLNYDRTIMI
jgi:hypothetical protein